MQKAGRTIGKWLRRVVTSDGWKLFQQTSREIQTLPNRLMREAALDELKEVQKDLKQPLEINRRPSEPSLRQGRPKPIRPCHRTLMPAASRITRFCPPPPTTSSSTDRRRGKECVDFCADSWRVITFPFRAIWWILTLPFRAIGATKRFMSTEPEEHPLGDVFVDLAQNASSREMFWEQVEALRGASAAGRAGHHRRRGHRVRLHAATRGISRRSRSGDCQRSRPSK